MQFASFIMTDNFVILGVAFTGQKANKAVSPEPISLLVKSYDSNAQHASLR